MGPVGRIAFTAVLLLIAPWWAIALPLRSVWRKTRVPDDAPPTAIDRFAERHPLLGRELRVPAAAKVAIAIVAIAVAVVIWLTKDSVDRLVWVGIVVLVGGSLVLGREHDL